MKRSEEEEERRKNENERGIMSVRCVIFKNVHDHGDGRLMEVPGSLDEFLKSAGDKLKMKAERAYTENGGIIDDVTLIRDDEKIFISSGEPFFKYASNSRMYKIAVLGSGGVGKSCLSMRYVKSTFVEIYDPTIEDAFRHLTQVDGTTVVLDILDTAGQEDMKMLRRQWVDDRDGFLLVYSVIERSSFDEVVQFFELIQQVKEDQIDKVPIVLVGNKCDMAAQRKVSQQEAQDLAKTYNAGYIEASAKEGINVNESFEMLVRHFLSLIPVIRKPPKKKPKCEIL